MGIRDWIKHRRARREARKTGGSASYDLDRGTATSTSPSPTPSPTQTGTSSGATSGGRTSGGRTSGGTSPKDLGLPSGSITEAIKESAITKETAPLTRTARDTRTTRDTRTGRDISGRGTTKDTRIQDSLETQRREQERERIQRDFQRQSDERARILAEKEQERIKKATERILVEGGRETVKTLTEKGTGDKIIVTTTIVDKIVNGKKVKERVVESFNEKTGETTIKTYKYDPKTRKVKLTGGIKTQQQETIFEELQEEKKERPKIIKKISMFGEALSEVPFFRTTLGGLGVKAYEKVEAPTKKVFKAFGDVPFYESTIIETAKELPTNILLASKAVSKIPIAIPEFDRDVEGKLEVRPSTIGRQAEVLFKEYPEMLGMESAKGYSLGFERLGIAEKKIKDDRVVITPAGYFVKGIKSAPKAIQYITPGLGQVAFAYDIQQIGERALPENIKRDAVLVAKKYYKDYDGDLTQAEYIRQVSPQIESQLRSGVKKEALLMGGVLLGGALLIGGTLRGVRAIRAARAPIIIERGGAKVVTTKAQQFFGKRVRVSKEGAEFLPSQRFKAKIEVKPLTPKTKSIEETIFIKKKPDVIDVVDDVTIGLFKDVKGVARKVIPGEKTIVTTPKETLFRGLSPYTKAGKAEKAATIKYFKKLGIAEDVTTPLLRFKRPEIIKTTLTGDVITLEKGAEKISLFRGKRLKTKELEIVDGIKTKRGVGEVSYIEAVGAPVIKKTTFQIRPPSALTPEIKLIKETKFIPERLGIKGDKTALEFQAARVKELRTGLTREGRPFSLLREGRKEVVTDVLGISERVGKREIAGFETELYKGVSPGRTRDIFAEQFKRFGAREIEGVGKGKIIVVGEKIKKTTPISFVRDEAKIKAGREKFLKQIEKGRVIELQKQKVPEIEVGKSERDLLVSLIERPKPKPVPKQTIKELELLATEVKVTPSVSGVLKEDIKIIKIPPVKLDTEIGQVTITVPETQLRKTKMLEKIELMKPRKELGKTVKQIKDQKVESLFKQVQVETKAQKQVQKQVQQQAQQQRAKQISVLFKQAMMPKTITEQIRPPRPPIKPIPKPIPKPRPKQPSAKDIIRQMGTGKFLVFEKIEGKDVETGTEFDLGKAVKKLKKGLKKGVQASGFIVEKKTGKKVKAEELLKFLGEEFRVSRISKTRVVQKRRKRLATGAETTEIQFFRKKRGGKKNGFF
jgi:hypothetical protein